jgi:hypothetical protein
MIRFTLGFLLLLVPLIAGAVDMERNIKFFQRHKDWVSLGVAEPIFGRVVVARAASEDSRTEATFTIDFFANERCSTDIQLVYKMNSLFYEPIIKQSVYGQMQVDNLDPLYVDGSLSANVGDKFIFLKLNLADKEIQKMKAARSVVFNIRHQRLATFSLSGFKSAYSKAKELCSNFVIQPNL